ncbi:MAG: YaiO family outer membrane beta-barrel protein [Flavobacterium sp.]|jgi:YaiO family outer membrane protein
MKKLLYIFGGLALLFSISSFGQDVDSLLIVTLNKTKNSEFPEALKTANKALKIAPNYLDFHLVKGQIHYKINSLDSAKFFLKHVIKENDSYLEAHAFLINTYLKENNYNDALKTTNSAIEKFPFEKQFQLEKLKILKLLKDDEQVILFLNVLVAKYPEDIELKTELSRLNSIYNHNRIGVNYNLTLFNREEQGPWHLSGIEYIHQKKKYSLIGRINLADRRSAGTFYNQGIQYELESYFTTSPKTYSFINLSYSNDIVFPKLRFSYSFFRNMGKGWEGDLGLRYNKTIDQYFYTGVFGIGKYTGSYWFNIKSYFLNDNSKIYPAFTSTIRKYRNTKFDYYSLIIGYGTSPDELYYLGLVPERFALESYRVGIGYNFMLSDKFIIGIQGLFNLQEYKINEYQQEYNLFTSFQYKF